MSMNATFLERYYNAPIGKVYAAMKQYLESCDCSFRLEDSDDLSCSLMFSSGVSMTTWGEKLTASAVPDSGGTMVRLNIVGRLGITAAGFQGSHNADIANEFFAGVSEVLAQMLSCSDDSSDSGASGRPIWDTASETSAEVEECADGNSQDADVAIMTEGPSEVTAQACKSEGSSSNPERAIPTDADDGEGMTKPGDSSREGSSSESTISSKIHVTLLPAPPEEERVQETETNLRSRLSRFFRGENSSLILGGIFIAVVIAVCLIIFIVVRNAPDAGVTSGTSVQASAQKTTDSHAASDGAGKNADDDKPVPFSVALTCRTTSGDKLDLSDLSHSVDINGVTNQNYRTQTWTFGEPVDCSNDSRGSVSAAEKSDTELKALQTAYEGTESDSDNALGTLYSLCASTSFIQMGIPAMSDGQGKELLGALVLCPDHPRAEEIKQKVEKDMARNAEIQAKRDQGLIKDEGTYTVPGEMLTGTWKTMNDKVGSCYWEVQDANGQIMFNRYVDEGIAQTVTIPQGAAGFMSQGCGSWEKQ